LLLLLLLHQLRRWVSQLALQQQRRLQLQLHQLMWQKEMPGCLNDQLCCTLLLLLLLLLHKCNLMHHKC
jgi:hypothetical protein